MNNYRLASKGGVDFQRPETQYSALYTVLYMLYDYTHTVCHLTTLWPLFVAPFNTIQQLAGQGHIYCDTATFPEEHVFVVTFTPIQRTTAPQTAIQLLYNCGPFDHIYSDTARCSTSNCYTNAVTIFGHHLLRYIRL